VIDGDTKLSLGREIDSKRAVRGHAGKGRDDPNWTLKAEIAGSNPACATKRTQEGRRLAAPAFSRYNGSVE